MQVWLLLNLFNSSFSIASWNINSVRLRIDLVIDFLSKHSPDILCLQETKTENAFFPVKAFRDIGYSSQALSGQKKYNGVCILSRFPLEAISREPVTAEDGARHISCTFADHFFLRNFYIPAGGDIADIAINPKFAHKIDFLKSLISFYKKNSFDNHIIVGDFNIAPHEHDVWSHKQLLKVVSHTPEEVYLLNELKEVGGFCDIFRDFSKQEDEKIYSWWSYRARDWKASNRGRRLDHIWCSNNLKSHIMDYEIYTEYRGASQPSDHVPILVRFRT